ncbi:MAG: hypothetical protein IBX40_02175 [Methanosarcinales archaeon]|nr:hypothetical protein [Methanosarcinales archaeon]
MFLELTKVRFDGLWHPGVFDQGLLVLKAVTCNIDNCALICVILPSSMVAGMNMYVGRTALAAWAATNDKWVY